MVTRPRFCRSAFGSGVGAGRGCGWPVKGLSGVGVLVRVVSTSGSPLGWDRPRRIGGPAARPLTGRGPHPRRLAATQTDAPQGDHSTLGLEEAGFAAPGRMAASVSD